MGLLYKLDFTSGKSYIGVTCRNASIRFKEHMDSVEGDSGCLVHQAWRKYGPPTKVKVLAEVEDYMLMETEQKAIATFGTMIPRGYNMTPGGETSPTSIPEIAQKVSVAMKGHSVSQATRQKLSDALKGRPLDPDRYKKFVMYWVGKKHTSETKRKMSAAQKGRTFSEGTRAKMSASQRRRYHHAS